MLGGTEIGILIKEAYTSLIGEDALHGFLEILFGDESFLDGVGQMGIGGAFGEIDVVAGIHGGGSSRHMALESGNLLDGGVVAHHHTIEMEIGAEDAVDNLFVTDAIGAVDGVIASHDDLAAAFADHGLVGKEDFFHEFFLFGVTATAIAEEMLAAGAHAFTKTAKLEAAHESGAKGCGEVGIFAIGFFQAVERGSAHDIDHR